MTTPSGELSSPNYPQPYPVSRECVWYVTVQPGSRINITIVDFDMEAHINCSFDMLAVSNLRAFTVQQVAENDHTGIANLKKIKIGISYKLTLNGYITKIFFQL